MVQERSQSLVNEGRFPLISKVQGLKIESVYDLSQSLVNEGRFPPFRGSRAGPGVPGGCKVAIPR